MSKREDIYNKLIKSGKVSEKNIGTLDQFTTALSNEDSAKKIYDKLIKSGRFTEKHLGDSDKFLNYIKADFAEKVPENDILSKNPSNTPTNPQGINQTNDSQSVNASNPSELGQKFIDDANKFGQMAGRVAEIDQTENKRHQDYRNDIVSDINDIDDRINIAKQEEENRIATAKEEQSRKTPLLSAFGESGAIVAKNPVQQEETKELQQLNVAQRKIMDVNTILDESAKKGNTNFFAGAIRGIADKLIDWRTWDFGATDLKDNANVISALNKAQNNKPLTSADEALLDATILSQEAEGEFYQDLGRGYKAGRVGAESLSFMAEMALNPLSKTGAYAVRKFGTEGAKRLSKQYAKNIALKATGDVVGAAGMAMTTGAVRTLADANERWAGDIYGLKGGGYIADNQENTSIGLIKALGAQTIENWSEMVGEYFGPVSNAIGKGTRKGLNKVGLKNVTGFIDNVKASDMAKAVDDFAAQTQWNGVFGEYLEEVVGTAANALTVGDSQLSDIVDKDQQIDTFLGVSLMGGIISGVKTIGYRTPRYMSNQALRKAEKECSDIEGWVEIKESIDNASEEELSTVLLNAIMSADDPTAIVNYVAELQINRGINIAETKRKIEGEVPAEQQVLESSYNNAYDNAVNASNEELRNAQQLVDNISNTLDPAKLQYLQETESDYLESLQSLIKNGNDVSKELQYLNAKATLDGYRDGLESNIQNEISYVRQTMESKSHENGTLITAENGSGERFNIISGNIGFDEDGNYSVNASDNILIAIDENGNKKQISSKDIESVVTEDPEQLISVLSEQLHNDLENRFTQPSQTEKAEIVNNISPGDEVTLNYNGGNVIGNIQDVSGNMATVMLLDEDNTPIQSIEIPLTELKEMIAGVSKNDTVIENNSNLPENDTQNEGSAQGEQSNLSKSNNLEVKTEPQKTEYPRNKQGEIDYSQISDVDVYSSALKEEFEDDAIDIVNDELKTLDKKLKDADKKTSAIEKARAKKAIKAQIDHFNAVRSRLINEVEVPTTESKKAEKEAVKTEVEENNYRFPEIQEKWNKAPKFEGREDNIVLANGDRIVGRYVLTDANAPTPSHNAENFSKSVGFPMNENGRTINDRDYENDKTSQQQVISRSQNYDERAVLNPIVVTKDGIVLSGNDRTMAGQLAAIKGTDKQYIDYITNNADKYGFTSEQITNVNNPRIVFVPEEEQEYTTNNFSRFNQDDKKGQDNTEQAVKAGKTISDETIGKLSRIFDNHEKLEGVYNNAQSVAEIIKILQNDGVIGTNEISNLVNQEGILSGAGKDRIETMIIGKLMEEKAVRQLSALPDLKNIIIKNSLSLIDNYKKGEYSLKNELSDAIDLVYNARKAGVEKGGSLELYLKQGNMFAETQAVDLYSETIVELADALNNGVRMFSKMINIYNKSSENAAQGQTDIFSGEIESKESILSRVLNQIKIDKNGTGKQAGSAINTKEEIRTNPTSESQSKEGVGTGETEKAEKQQIDQSLPSTQFEKDLATIEKASKKAKSNKKEESEAKRLVSDDRMEELKKRLRSKLNQLNAGIDPEMIAIGSELAVAHIERGVTKFKDYAKQMIEDLGENVKPFLKMFYNAGRDFPGNPLASEMDSYNSVSAFNLDELNNVEENEVSKEAHTQFIDTVKNKLGSEKLTIVQLRKLAKEAGLDISDIQIQEYTEMAIISKAKDIANSNLDTKTKFNDIVKLYENQPTISMRDSNRVEKQQYSTPIPMSFLAGEFIKEGNPKSVLEPSAGNGMMVFNIDDSIVTVNEIDVKRLANLKEQNFNEVTEQDATLPFENKYDAIVTNPPFGSTPAKDYNGYKISGLDEQMVVNALGSLNENGRGAIIIGGNTKYTNAGALASEKAFLNYLYNYYNVVDVINMGGNLYSKQGTSFPTRMILINGKRNSDEVRYAPVKSKAKAEQINNFEDLYNRIINKENETALLDKEQQPDSNRKQSNDGRSVVENNKESLLNLDGTNGESVRDSNRTSNASRTNDSSNTKRMDEQKLPDNVEGRNNAVRGNDETAKSNTEQKSDTNDSGGNGNIQSGSMVSENVSQRSESKNIQVDIEKEKVQYPSRSKSKDTRDNSDLFVVGIDGYIGKDEYRSLNAKAKENNGYYSSFKKGFIFKTEEDAINFKEDKANILYRDRDVNFQFNNDLNKQIAGTLPKNHIYKLGRPSEILQSAGIPNLPIEMTASQLIYKATSGKHDYKLSDVADLPKSISNPIATFAYGDKNKSQNILTVLEHNGENFIVGMFIRPTVKGRVLEINSVRNVFPKKNDSIMQWILDGKLTSVDKKKLLAFLDQQRTNYADVAFVLPDKQVKQEKVEAPEESNKLSQQYNSADIAKLYELAIKVVNEFVNPPIPSVKNTYRNNHLGKTSLMQNKEKREMAEMLADTLNEKIKFVSIEELPDNRKTAKGYFDTKTGEICLCLDNHSDIADIEATILHETVAHKGLREMFGKDFDSFVRSVYKNADKAVRNKIVSLAKNNNWDIELATEEYMAGLAEKGFNDIGKSVWSKIKDLFHNLLKKIGINLSQKLSDNDLRYILWKSYQKRKGDKTFVGKALDMDIRKKLSLNNTSKNGVLFRDNKDQEIPKTVKEIYEERLNQVSYKLTEAYQDSMLAVKEVQEAIEKTSGKKIKDNENIYFEENRMSSKSHEDAEMYIKKYFNPLLDEISKLTELGAKYEDLKKYVVAKHGLERNRLIAWQKSLEGIKEKNSREVYEKIEESYEISRDEINQRLNNGTITKEESIQEIEDLRAGIIPQYISMRLRDYAGLSALTGEIIDFETAAQEYVTEFESRFYTNDLWDKINKATKKTLRTQFEAGMTTRSSYEKVSKMYEHYIPLRGFNENVASDVYEYLLSEKSVISAPLKNANGRSSLADDPFATIGNMAESGILMANRNLMKQKALNLTINHKNELLSVRSMWYVYDEVAKEWIRSFPDIPDNATIEERDNILEDFENRMKELEAEEKATKKKKGLKIGYRTSEKERQEHMINVKMGGQEYVILVNGNPRFAQAVNGLTNPEMKGVIQKVNRLMAANITSLSPAFVFSNLSRDLIQSSSTIFIKENGKYFMNYEKNLAKSLKNMSSLMKRYENNKLDENDKFDLYFKEFMEEGARTGYTALNTVDDYKKKIDKHLRKFKKIETAKDVVFKATDSIPPIADAVEFMNSWAENMSRFATYVTSREDGRSILQSVNNAKEVTVNFNKKGSGGYGANWLKHMYFFFGASIQGLANFGRLIKNNPKKTASVTGGFGAAGFLMPILNEVLIQALGGDDDAYDNLPDYVRRNNLCLYTGKGFITIPLPFELRAFYGLGDILYQSLKGNMIDKNIPLEVLNQLAELLPLNPISVDGFIPNSTSAAMIKIAPDLLKPLLYLANNETFAQVPIYKKNTFNEHDPYWTKAYKSTNQTLVNWCRDINQLSGGDKYTKGEIDINPAAIEYLFSSYFGGLGTFANQSYKTVQGAVNGDVNMYNIPIVNRFFQSDSNDRNTNRRLNELYIYFSEKADAFNNSVDGYEKDIKSGNDEYFNKFVNDKQSNKNKLFTEFDFYSRMIDKLRKESKIASDESAEEINKKIKELKARAVNLMISEYGGNPVSEGK